MNGLLLARFSENEETVRTLMATDARFNKHCDEYRKVTGLLDELELEVARLRHAMASVIAQVPMKPIFSGRDIAIAPRQAGLTRHRSYSFRSETI
ncbi:hypothetical protein GGE12_007206 [Rhizobium mongolense]|uniref:Uncharacterized protein n=1 Tax=Rhizobium mongolense TaxID=57676 RepID=A0A7W6RVU2_9HYPH|nr:hypothetical protein [Rhizobium mongolense]